MNHVGSSSFSSPPEGYLQALFVHIVVKILTIWDMNLMVHSEFKGEKFISGIPFIGNSQDLGINHRIVLNHMIQVICLHQQQNDYFQHFSFIYYYYFLVFLFSTSLI